MKLLINSYKYYLYLILILRIHNNQTKSFFKYFDEMIHDFPISNYPLNHLDHLILKLNSPLEEFEFYLAY